MAVPREGNGLYFSENGTFSTKSIPSIGTCFEYASVPSVSEIMLWHYSLGHPSFFIFETLISEFVC